jgi:hypothetical protein
MCRRVLNTDSVPFSTIGHGVTLETFWDTSWCTHRVHMSVVSLLWKRHNQSSKRDWKRQPFWKKLSAGFFIFRGPHKSETSDIRTSWVSDLSVVRIAIEIHVYQLRFIFMLLLWVYPHELFVFRVKRRRHWSAWGEIQAQSDQVLNMCEPCNLWYSSKSPHLSRADQI